MTKAKKKTNDGLLQSVYFAFTTLIISLSLLNFMTYFINRTPNINYSFDKEKKFWEDVARKNPMYIDAYLEIAKINMATGNLTNAKTNIDNAYAINPNTQKIKKIDAVLGVMISID